MTLDGSVPPNTQGLTYVLIPGGWHGAWSWRPVANRLRAAGHRAITLTLPGMGDGDDPRGHKLRDAVDYIVDEVRRLELDNVILVAHSWGGYPATGAAHLLGDRVTKVVYYNAFVPVGVRSLVDETHTLGRHPSSGFDEKSDRTPTVHRVQVNRITADYRRQLNRSPGGGSEFGDGPTGGHPQSTLRAHPGPQPQQARTEPIAARRIPGSVQWRRQAIRRSTAASLRVFLVGSWGAYKALGGGAPIVDAGGVVAGVSCVPVAIPLGGNAAAAVSVLVPGPHPPFGLLAATRATGARIARLLRAPRIGDQPD